MTMLYMEVRKTRYFDAVPKTKWFAWTGADAIAIGHFNETTEEYLAIPTVHPDQEFERVRMKIVMENYGMRVQVTRIGEQDYRAVMDARRSFEEAMTI